MWVVWDWSGPEQRDLTAIVSASRETPVMSQRRTHRRLEWRCKLDWRVSRSRQFSVYVYIASESVNCVVTYFLYITQVPATLPPVHAVCRSVTSIVYIRWRDFFRQCSSFVGNLTDTSLRCLSIARCLFSLRFCVDLSIVAVRFEWPSANFYSTTPQFIGDQIWTTAWCSSIDARSPCSKQFPRQTTNMLEQNKSHPSVDQYKTAKRCTSLYVYFLTHALVEAFRLCNLSISCIVFNPRSGCRASRRWKLECFVNQLIWFNIVILCMSNKAKTSRMDLKIMSLNMSLRIIGSVVQYLVREGSPEGTDTVERICWAGYDTIEEFNVDSKALSSTRSQKKETKTNKRQCPFNTVQVKIRECSLEGIRVTCLLYTSDAADE